VSRNGHDVAVLGYHRVGPPPPGSWETWFSVPEETFEEQLRTLVAAGWTPIDAATFVAGLDDPSKLPARAAVITFDDAYKSLGGSARATLARLGLPGVVFVPVEHVGGRNAWDTNSAQPSEAVCSWDDLRALERAGICVQSHAVTHRGFSTLDPAELEREIGESKARLERELGKRVDLLAYPYGDAGPPESDAAAVIERAGYSAAFLFGGGPFTLPARDRFHLPRIAVGPDTDLHVELARIT
jgi:peptidoglycan/xylan/chitin deacetylase (PgdA/CDA1 family)